MTIQPFKLERYFARYEFKVKYLLSSSDCESLGMDELLGMASPASLELWQKLKLGYTESPGHPILRQEIARMYAHLSAEDMIVATPEEAIYIAMHSLLRPGDEVIAISPAYQSLYEVAKAIGCQVRPWRLQPESPGWQADLKWLEENLSDKTRLLVINFPHNPTGHTLTRDEFDIILAMAAEWDLIVFSDEMYRMLEWEQERRLPPVCDLYERGISLSGLSKSFALPGLRIGWLATQQKGWLDSILSFKYYTTICNSAPSEILAIIALQNQERILRRNQEIVRKNLRLAQEFFGSRAQLFEWLEPLAGSVAFPVWKGEGTIEDFCLDLVEKQGVMIVPGSLFDYPGSHFRIGLGRMNFEEALEQLEDYLG